MFYLLSFIIVFTSVIFTANATDWAGDFLIGISIRTTDFERRQLMREAQIDTYKDSGFPVTWKFVLLRPDTPEIRERIMQENQTYGDIIIIEKFEDSRKNSITVKPYEWFEYVEHNMPKYRYVAKMDEDAYINITGLYDVKFTNKVKLQLKTMISSFHIWIPDQQLFPHGGFYALSWDLMLKINRLYETQPMVYDDELEDLQIAYFLKNASIFYHKVYMTSIKVSCEYKPFDANGKFDGQCNLTQKHQEGWKGMIRIHWLKNDELYGNVSAYFIQHERKRLGQPLDDPWYVNYMNKWAKPINPDLLYDPYKDPNLKNSHNPLYRRVDDDSVADKTPNDGPVVDNHTLDNQVGNKIGYGRPLLLLLAMLCFIGGFAFYMKARQMKVNRQYDTMQEEPVQA